MTDDEQQQIGGGSAPGANRGEDEMLDGPKRASFIPGVVP
jgi:hypothetical protein